MGFETEPTGYMKTAFSDLQGSWGNLRDAVVNSYSFDDADELLFHIDEAISWESVRNLKQMKSTLLLIENIISQTDSPNEIVELVENVRESLEATFVAISDGEAQ